MSDAPPIPYGYRQITGPAQKGDGIWDGTRFRKARKVWPSTEATAACIIRKCEVVQGGGIPATITEPVGTVAEPVGTVAEPVQTITDGPDCVGPQAVECDFL